MSTNYEKYFQKPSLQNARKRKNISTDIIKFDVPFNVRHLGMGKKYLIKTFGCQGNEADSETISGILSTLDFQVTTIEREADLIILNTCAIRETAENRVFGEIGRLKQYKKTNPNLILGIAGCMPQEENVIERILKTHHHIDLVFGTHNIHKLPEYLETAMHAKERVIEVYSTEGEIIEELPKRREHHQKAWVNIMYGCDEFCTYCIVPYTRGKERSREMTAIILEVESLIKEGYKEVTLLGQNVNAYGRDLPSESTSFTHLLERLSQLDIPRIRFTTSHPNDFDESMIKVIAQSNNIMPHIHLPVQSGSNNILNKMNRKYTKESYLDLVRKINHYLPNVSITTDIIVGFPGETEDDFQETLDLVTQSNFEGAFTFIFSPRSGTPAAKYQDDTSFEIKQDRLQRLNKVINEGSLLGNKRFINQVLPVFVEGVSKKNETLLAGYTPHHKLINFKGPKQLIGSIVNVKVTEAKTWSMKGELHESS